MDAHTEVTGVSITTGLLTRKAVAAELKCDERSVFRREKAGMPVIKIGALRLYNPATVRAWLMTLERHRDTPKRGRPRHAA